MTSKVITYIPNSKIPRMEKFIKSFISLFFSFAFDMWKLEIALFSKDLEEKKKKWVYSN